jgi:hypothetical protein
MQGNKGRYSATGHTFNPAKYKTQEDKAFVDHFHHASTQITRVVGINVPDKLKGKGILLPFKLLESDFKFVVEFLVEPGNDVLVAHVWKDIPKLCENS